MKSKIYLAIILSDYQEINLKRYVNYYHIKDKIILLKFSKNKKKHIKFPKNTKRKIFSNKYIFLFYFFLISSRYFFYKKKFIFGNPAGKFCTFLRYFINGKNQIYVDDGFQTVYYNFDRLKKNSTVFTVYDINLPSKLNKIRYIPKYVKKKKKTYDTFLFIGSPFVSNIGLSEDKFTVYLSKDKFKKIMQNLSKKNKKYFYYPHRNEIKELSLLPKNFKIIKRSSSVEKFIYNNKFNFKKIYSFGSSSICEIINFYKKEKIRIIDINEWFSYSNHNALLKMKIIINYLKKLKLKIIKIKINNI